jgi:hypothetical protein
MSISPDKSAFTACVLGECPPAEKQAFEIALLQNAALREEAVAVSRIAHRLSTALKQEPAVGLTLTQRHAVLNQGTAPASAFTSRPAVSSARRAWVGTTLATVGVAAALAIGLYLIPSESRRSQDAQAEVAIPAVSIHPASTSRPPGKPVAPPPQVTSGHRGSSSIPETAPPESPAQAMLPPAMAANPPTIMVEPAPAPPRIPDGAVPGKPLKPGTAEESLAKPGARPGP